MRRASHCEGEERTSFSSCTEYGSVPRLGPRVVSSPLNKNDFPLNCINQTIFLTSKNYVLHSQNYSTILRRKKGGKLLFCYYQKNNYVSAIITRILCYSSLLCDTRNNNHLKIDTHKLNWPAPCTTSCMVCLCV